MTTDVVERLQSALEIARQIGDKTVCPDPAEGGCIGGPIPGVGCINEGARAIERRIEEALKSLASTKCIGCSIEAEIGSEENPHPVPARFHTCKPMKAS